MAPEAHEQGRPAPGRGRARRSARLLLLCGLGTAATLAFLPQLGAIDPWIAARGRAPSGPPAPTVAEPSTARTAPPTGPAACRCVPPWDRARWGALLDFLATQPEGEVAVLASAGAWLAPASYGTLRSELPAHRVLGLARDPTSPVGYRLMTPEAEATESATRVSLPDAVRLLVVPDAYVADLLDPATLAVEHLATTTGDSVAVVRLPARSTLELRMHAGHPHVVLSQPERDPAEPLPRLLVLGARMLSPITGPASPNDPVRWDFFGSDLANVFWHDDRLQVTFGDSFGRGNRWSGRNWRSNAMAVLEPVRGRPEELRFASMVSGGFGWAREILPSRKVDNIEMTVLPTSGVSVGHRMFLHYQSVRHWIESGFWQVGHAGIAYSDDGGQHWIRPASARWPGRIGFEQAALVRHEGMVYAFGIPAGRVGPIRLRRVAEDQILEAAAWEYWNGGGWSPAPVDAAPLFPGPAGQLSVAWNPRHRLWMMLYLDPSQDAIVLRLAPTLTGPWSEEQVAVRGQHGAHPGLYAPYILPIPQTGEEVWFTMSKWWPYNVFLMRMTLAEGAPLVVR